MVKNPFDVFGLTPEMVGSLSEKELFGVLKSLYRSLLKTVHPDVAQKHLKKKEGNRAVDLNLAFEALNLDKNIQSFRRHRKNFVARQPRIAYQRSLLLEQELVRGAAREESLAQAYFQRLGADYGWPETEQISAVDEDNPLAIDFPLKNVRLGLLDVAINQNLKGVSWSVGSNYKEIIFDAQQTLSVRQVGRSRFRRAGYIHLIGTVPVEAVDLMPLLEQPPAKFFKSPALAGPDSTGPSISVLNLISEARFKSQVLVHLKPRVTERAYLFSFNRPEFQNKGFVSLEGLVVKIERFKPEKV